MFNAILSACHDRPRQRRTRARPRAAPAASQDRKSTRLNSSHVEISYAVFCLKKKRDQNNWRGMLTYSAHFSNSASYGFAISLADTGRQVVTRLREAMSALNPQQIIEQLSSLVDAGKVLTDEESLKAYCKVFFLMFRPPPRSTLFPYTTLFR